MRRVLIQTFITYAAMAALVAVTYATRPPVISRALDAALGRGEVTFAYPWLLWLVLLVVPVVFLVRSHPTQKKVAAMVFTRGDLLVDAPRTLKSRLRGWPLWMRALGLAALIIAVARPQAVSRETRESEGIDIYLVLDMSGSMQAIDMTQEELDYLQWANQQRQDPLIPMNRFEIAQEVLNEFVARREEKVWSDRLGMVVFARNAFLQFPLTVDYQTITWLINELNLNHVDGSATAIGNALGLAVVNLVESDAESRIVILITDGNERGGNISAEAAAQVASDQNIQIFPILVGREGQVFVPRRHNFFVEYLPHEYPVNPELLMTVAEASGGEFFRAEDRQTLDTTLEEILERYEKSDYEAMVTVQQDELFFPFAWAGLFLLGLDLFFRFTVVRQFP